MENILEGFSLLGDTEKHISDLETEKWKSPNHNNKKNKLKN